MVTKRENLHTKSGIYKSFKGMHPDTNMSADAQSYILKATKPFPFDTVMTHKFHVGLRVILDRAGNYAIRDGRRTVSLQDVKDAFKNHPLKFKSPKSKSPKRKSSKRKSPKRKSGKKASPKRKSSKRKSAKKASPKRKSPKRKSAKKASPRRKSSKRKSSKKKSPKRKSPKRKSPKRKSSKRKSPKSKSPKRKSPKKASPKRKSSTMDSRCYVISGTGFSPRKARRAEAEKLIKALKKQGFHPQKTQLKSDKCKQDKPTRY